MEYKVSVVVTVKNDEVGVAKLKKALGCQTVKPDEVIIIRADDYGNCSRGRGRNIGVRRARNEVIAVTDAGCRPHEDWIEKLVEKVQKSTKKYKKGQEGSKFGVDGLAVAGWYRVVVRRPLQRVMARFLVPEEFYEETPRHPSRSLLPASRSIMFTKAAWEAVGGYPEEAVSGAEDLEFARRLAAHPSIKVIQCPEALVDWEPPETLGEFFRDIVKHTRGNVEVRYWPHLIKNFTVVLRWMVFLAFPWMIPIYLGIKIIKIKNTIDGSIKDSPWRTPRTVLFIAMAQLVADAGMITGLALGVWGKFGRLGKLGKFG